MVGMKLESLSVQEMHLAVAVISLALSLFL